MAKRAVLCSFFLSLFLASLPAFAKDTAWQAPYAAAKKALQQNRPALAEKFFKEAIRKAEAGKQDERRRDELVAGIQYELAALFLAQSRYDEAAGMYQRSLSLLGKTLGPTSRRVCWVSSEYAQALRKAGRTAEANQVRTCEKGPSPRP